MDEGKDEYTTTKKQKNKLPYLENQATGVTVFLLAVIL